MGFGLTQIKMPNTAIMITKLEAAAPECAISRFLPPWKIPHTS